MIINEFGEKYYKLGLHLHSTLSDGSKTPEEIAREYKLDGYDAIAITDHWVYGEGGNIEGLHIISGCEYNLGGVDTIAGVAHILSLFAKSNPNPKRDASVQEVVDAINANDGIAVLAHPAWSLNHPSVLIEAKGIVATEIYNAVSDAGQSLRAYSDYYVDICANAGTYPKILATDDAHAIVRAALPYTNKNSVIIVDGLNRSKAVQKWWQQLVDDSATVVTYDMYSYGILLFDKERIKQHYTLKK